MMMSFDLLLHNTRAVIGNTIVSCDIGIIDGKIAALLEPNIGNVRGVREYDVENRIVVPGAIDTHAHIGQVDSTLKGDAGSVAANFSSESLSALAGGVTTAVNYVKFGQNSLLETYAGEMEVAQQFGHMNFLFHGYLMNDLHLDELARAFQKGLHTFKIFMPYRGEEARSLGGISSLNDFQMQWAFRKLASLGGMAMVHAEDGDIVEYSTRNMEAHGGQSLAAWEASRPIEAEGDAALRAIYLAQLEQCPITIVHVSSHEALRARNALAYPNMRMETCPHYLVLATEQDLGPQGKVAPPIRERRESIALWEAIESHTLDFLGSDHNVWIKEAKEELWSAKAGLPGIGLMMPLFASEGIFNHGLSWPDVVRFTSTNAAQWFGLYPQKGVIAVGSDADLVIMDQGTKTVPSEDPFSIVNYSPYAGWKLSTWPWATIVHGRWVYHDGVFLTEHIPARILNTGSSRQS